MKIDENNYETIKKVESITLGDYNIYWKDAENIDGYIDSYDMFNMVSDLLCEVESLHELIQDMKEDITENYERKPFDPYAEYGISEKDFQ